jgi:hypothetical protein
MWHLAYITVVFSSIYSFVQFSKNNLKFIRIISSKINPLGTTLTFLEVSIAIARLIILGLILWNAMILKE